MDHGIKDYNVTIHIYMYIYIQESVIMDHYCM